MLKRVFTFFAIVYITACFGQGTPIIINDSAEVFAGNQIEVNVLANDWWKEGHTAKIFFVSSLNIATSFNDSIIFCSPDIFSMGVDSIEYRILDEDNNMVSEPGYLFLSINNHEPQILDVNNIKASFHPNGHHFLNLHGSGFEAPKGSGLFSIGNMQLWIGGLDENNQLHIAAEKFRNEHSYLPGPVGSFYSDDYTIKWNRVWKLTKEDIEYHISNWDQAGYNTSEMIQSWPAHGDINNGEASNLAPFFDANNDQIYSPESGDFPLIKGDQAIYFLYNDDAIKYEGSAWKKTGVEVQGLAYEFDCDINPTFDNTVFLDYQIINRSDTTYYNTYFGLYLNFNIGGDVDDYLGCDTLLNLCYAYNGDDYDGSVYYTNGVWQYGYEDHPPAQGAIFLDKSFNNFMQIKPNGNSMGFPFQPQQYYKFLKALWNDGTPHTYGGNGYGGTEPFNFAFPGDVNDPSAWSEVSAQNPPYISSGLPVIGPNTFYPDDTLSFKLALVFARDFQGDYLSSVGLLKESVESIRWYYENDSTPCETSWSSTKKTIKPLEITHVFPNPTSGLVEFNFRNQNNIAVDLNVYNTFAHLIKRLANIRSSKIILDASDMKPGLYIYSLSTRERIIGKGKLIIK